MAAPARSNPWYREPWPWLVMAGPAIVVVAGVITTAIAVGTSDGLVADDYYKQGLGINRVIERDARAAALGVSAYVRFNEERNRVQALLHSREPMPPSLRLALVHPTRAGADQQVALVPVAPGVYEGTMAAPRRGAWHLKLEDGQGAWRIAGEWKTREAAANLRAAKP